MIKHQISICDICDTNTGLECYRYKCLVCINYDLCSRCFENELTNKEHQLGHPMVRIEDPDHLFGQYIPGLNEMNLERLRNMFAHTKQNVSCNGCLVENVEGLIFRCENCPRTNICYMCYYSKKYLEIINQTTL